MATNPKIKMVSGGQEIDGVFKPISADVIGSTQPVVLPAKKSSDAALTKLEASLTPTAPTETQQQAPAPTTDIRQSLVQRQLSALEQLRTRPERTQEIMQEQQLKQRQDALSALDEDIARRERYYENRFRDFQDKGGGLQIGVEGELNTIRRNRAREMADLYIVRSAKQQDLDSARQYANDLVNAEFEPLKEELQYTSQLYNLLQNDMSESEQLQAQAKIQEKQSATQYAQSVSQNVYDALFQAGAVTPERLAIVSGAMQEATSLIAQGQSPAEAVQKMSQALQGVVSPQQQQIALQRAKLNFDKEMASLSLSMKQMEEAASAMEAKQANLDAQRAIYSASGTAFDLTESLYRELAGIASTPAVSGGGLSRIGNFMQGITQPGAGSLFKSQLEQLKGIITVENRQKLKGQGTITDKEQDALAAAETWITSPEALTAGEAAWEPELQRLGTIFKNSQTRAAIRSFSPTELEQLGISEADIIPIEFNPAEAY